MNELTIQELIKAKFSGELDPGQVYLNLILQSAAVLVAGIVLWRASNAIHNKKLRERQGRRMESPYSKHWRK